MSKSKAELRARIADLKRELTLARVGPSFTYETLTICFPDKTVDWNGHLIHAEHDCLSIPIVQVDVR